MNIIKTVLILISFNLHSFENSKKSELGCLKDMVTIQIINKIEHSLCGCKYYDTIEDSIDLPKQILYKDLKLLLDASYLDDSYRIYKIKFGNIKHDTKLEDETVLTLNSNVFITCFRNNEIN